MTRQLQVTPEQTIKGLASKFQEMAASHNKVVFASECAYALGALEGNDFLMKIATQNPASFKNAILNVAGAGISLNPVSKHAYLVPRKVFGQMQICLDVSYMGMAHLAVSTGSMLWVNAEIVRANDDFTVGDVDTVPSHKFHPFKERGEIVGVYCIGKTNDGSYLTRTMTLEKIHDIRGRSESYKKAAEKRNRNSPWITDFEEMAKKAVIKQASKTWPKSDRRLETAVDIVNQHEGINFEKETDPNYVAPIRIDYSLREKQIGEIKTLLGFLTEGLTAQQKMDFLINELDVKSFLILEQKTNDDLEGIINKLNLLRVTKESKETLEEDSPREDMGTMGYTPEPEKKEEPKKVIIAFIICSCSTSAKEKKWYIKDVAQLKQIWVYCDNRFPKHFEKGICYRRRKCYKTIFKNEKCIPDLLFCAHGDLQCYRLNKWPEVKRGGAL